MNQNESFTEKLGLKEDYLCFIKGKNKYHITDFASNNIIYPSAFCGEWLGNRNIEDVYDEDKICKKCLSQRMKQLRRI